MSAEKSYKLGASLFLEPEALAEALLHSFPFNQLLHPTKGQRRQNHKMDVCSMTTSNNSFCDANWYIVMTILFELFRGFSLQWVNLYPPDTFLLLMIAAWSNGNSITYISSWSDFFASLRAGLSVTTSRQSHSRCICAACLFRLS